MIGRFKHDFPQLALATPFKTVLLSELERALVAKRLHNRIPREPRLRKARPDWGSDRFVWVRRPRHPLVQEAARWAGSQIRSDLKAGLLTAYMPTNTGGVFHDIPAQFWHDRRSGIRDGEMLFDVASGKMVPDEIDECMFCVVEECARAWLKLREIDESNPAFPNSLRSGLFVEHSLQASGQETLEQLLRLMQGDIPCEVTGAKLMLSSPLDEHTIPMADQVAPLAGETGLRVGFETQADRASLRIMSMAAAA